MHGIGVERTSGLSRVALMILAVGSLVIGCLVSAAPRGGGSAIPVEAGFAGYLLLSWAVVADLPLRRPPERDEDEEDRSG